MVNVKEVRTRLFVVGSEGGDTDMKLSLSVLAKIANMVVTPINLFFTLAIGLMNWMY